MRSEILTTRTTHSPVAQDRNRPIRLSRRQFVTGLGAFAAGAALGVGGKIALSAEASPRRLLRANFARHLGQNFRVQMTDGSRAPLQLVAVHSLRPGDGSEKSFSLLFEGPAAAPLAQGTYLFEHWRMGRAGIFIVPVNLPTPTHQTYEAVFNRL